MSASPRAQWAAGQGAANLLRPPWKHLRGASPAEHARNMPVEVLLPARGPGRWGEPTGVARPLLPPGICRCPGHGSPRPWLESPPPKTVGAAGHDHVREELTPSPSQAHCALHLGRWGPEADPSLASEWVTSSACAGGCGRGVGAAGSTEGGSAGRPDPGSSTSICLPTSELGHSLPTRQEFLGSCSWGGGSGVWVQGASRAL